MLFHISSINILAAAAVFLMSGCTDSIEAAKKPRELLTVVSQKVQESESYTVEREYVGTIFAGQKANLGFELSGKISEIRVDVGQVVKKGQALISLDTQLLNTELEQLAAQLEEIKAQQKLIRANLNRQYSLKKKGFSSDSEIDLLISQKEALQANILRIQAAVGTNKLKQQKSTIKAPYSGIVSKRFVSLGDVVAVGTPTLLLLSEGNKEAVIGVHNNDIKGIESQGHYVIRVENKGYSAKLISQASNIDSTSRSVSLRFLLENEPSLLDGELAYLSYKKIYPAKGYWLPNTALIDGMRGTWNIFTLNTVDNHKIVERRSVQVLFANSQSVYVQGALSNGDEVIMTGLHKVVPGQSVYAAQ
ncbi:efflux RND transporter periplasmic adaptor subunit [Psychromonas ossibalaenae]|uniref:efflux RND transporter periplasmic adaptor subunit n=1 Tax=Psychromonas ossibalaenae TaxID=444922 RepID=UPI0003720343|nr:efflux RND transporter periplasmic adaptor subunit [Psychromonas ossibalaenae]